VLARTSIKKVAETILWNLACHCTFNEKSGM